MTIIERTLRKELRTRRILDPTEPVAIIDDGSARCKVAQLLLSRIMRTEVELVPEGTRRRRNVARATSLELELVLGLGAFLEDRTEERRETRVMTTVPEEEIAAFARKNGTPVMEPMRDDVRQLIERLQDCQPQTKPALSKSLAALRNVSVSRKNRGVVKSGTSTRRP
jgi:hypothetical protein